MRIRFSYVACGVAMGLGLGAAPPAALATAPSVAEQCEPPAGWFVPGGGVVDGRSLLSSMSQRSVVLLGERHTDADHHRWQLETIRALHQRRPNLVLAFEMFPRRVQPVLDRWIAGDLSEREFLHEARWKEVWGVNPDLYMPIFRYARDHHIAMRAVNVDHSLVRAVRKGGFGAVPADRREGLTEPAAASPAYQAWLRSIYSSHGAKHGSKQADDGGNFARFVQAQQTWDRAMAQGIADSLRQHPGALVVGVMGSGHIVHGYGVPSQLRDLGVADVGTLLPWDKDADCENLAAGSADAMYGLNGPLTGRRFATLGISLSQPAASARKPRRARST